MHRPTPLNIVTLTTPSSISRSPLRRGFPVVLLTFALALFALAPTALAVDPPPDGGYPNQNTAEGDGALNRLTTGSFNTATGSFALFSNTTGNNNTANGSSALAGNTTGNNNTANGCSALAGVLFSTAATGSNNTATGFGALQNNSTGNSNTANGVGALQNNSSGGSNTANGYFALPRNTTGIKNTANGVSALFANTSGNSNTAMGNGALSRNTSGSFNVALGSNAGAGLTTGSNNIDIGGGGVAGESNTMRIGTGKQTATFITGIRGTATANANAVPVVIDSAGQLGTMSSSRRFKDEIKPMDNSSEAILGLKPVTFHYKTDKQNTPQFGLIAEEVAKVNPDLVVRDDNGEIYTVRYEAVNAMLLNEFLKEHRKVEEQGAMIAKQQKQIEALTAAVQKVSDQVAHSDPAPQLVVNP